MSEDELIRKQEELKRLEAELIGNAMVNRADFFRKMMDPRRNVYDECGYPSGWLPPDLFQQLYDREAIGARVVEVLPKETWQVQPNVWEDDDPETVTPFEEAWDALAQQLQGEASWYKDEKGNPVWDYLLRADILSGIGQYGIIFLGLDDNADLQQPVEGMIEENSQPKTKVDGDGKKAAPDTDEEAAAMKMPKLPPKPKAVANGLYRLVTNASALPFTKKKPPSPANPAEPVPGAPSTDLGPLTPDPQGVKGAGTYPAEIDPPTKVTEEDDTADETTDSGGSSPKHQLQYMRVFPESQAKIVQYEGNRSSPRYGQPTMYSITFADPSREPATGIGAINETRYVHWTRVVHVADTHHQAASCDWAAAPRMKPVLNNVLGCQKLGCGSPEMYWRGAFPGISFETHPQLGGDVKINKEKMRDQAENYMNSLQRYLVLMGMSAKSLAPTVSDVTPHLDKQIELICIKLGIPVRIFKGSERGELASGQDDGTWNDRLRERQNDYVTPKIIVRFVDRLIAVGALPQPQQFSVEWPDLESQTDAEKAQVALQRTQALVAYAGGNVEPIIAPLDFLTKIIGLDEEEAQQVLDNAKAAIDEGGGVGVMGQAAIDQQSAAIDAGTAADPTEAAQTQADAHVEAAGKLAKAPGGVHLNMPGAGGGGFPPGGGSPLGAKAGGTPNPMPSPKPNPMPAPPGGSKKPPFVENEELVDNWNPNAPTTNMVYNVDAGDKLTAADHALLAFYSDNPEARNKWLDEDAGHIKDAQPEPTANTVVEFITNDDPVDMKLGLTLNDTNLAENPNLFLDRLAAGMAEMLKQLNVNGEQFMKDRLGKLIVKNQTVSAPPNKDDSDGQNPKPD